MQRRREPTDEVAVVPVVHERLVLERRERDAERVRVTKTVEETNGELDVAWVREEADVERIPIGKVVDEPPRTRVEGATTIIPVVEEIVVVEKRLLLREEVRVTKRTVEETKQIREPLRKERIDIEHDRRKP